MLDLFVADLDAPAQPKRLTAENLIMAGVAWEPDGRHIVCSWARGGPDALWRIPAAGGTPERVAGVGVDAIQPSIASQTGRLAFMRNVLDYNIWRLPLGRPGASPEKLISSSRFDAHAEYSVIGNRIAFISQRSGTPELWVSNADGSEPAQLTSFKGPVTTAPRWSPDGSQIVFASRPGGNIDVYLIRAEGGSPRRMTQEPAEDHSAQWSRDGGSIYFCSNRTGRHEVWKMPAAGGTEVQVTRNGGWASRESRDGQFLYYTKFDAPGLWRIPITGGSERLVVATNMGSRFALGESGIHVSDVPTRAMLFFDFKTGKISTTHVADKEIFNVGLAVSPDGKWLMYSQLDQSIQDIILLER